MLWFCEFFTRVPCEKFVMTVYRNDEQSLLLVSGKTRTTAIINKWSYPREFSFFNGLWRHLKFLIILGKGTGKICCHNGKRCPEALPIDWYYNLLVRCLKMSNSKLSLWLWHNDSRNQWQALIPHPSSPAESRLQLGKHRLSSYCVPGTVTTARGCSAGYYLYVYKLKVCGDE